MLSMLAHFGSVWHWAHPGRSTKGGRFDVSKWVVDNGVPNSAHFGEVDQFGAMLAKFAFFDGPALAWRSAFRNRRQRRKTLRRPPRHADSSACRRTPAMDTSAGRNGAEDPPASAAARAGPPKAGTADVPMRDVQDTYDDVPIITTIFDEELDEPMEDNDCIAPVTDTPQQGSLHLSQAACVTTTFAGALRIAGAPITFAPADFGQIWLSSTDDFDQPRAIPAKVERCRTFLIDFDHSSAEIDHI